METSQERGPSPGDDDVPIFGSWRGIYTAVIVCALTVMGLVAIFSNFPF